MSTLFMLGFTAGNIFSTNTIPYALFGITGTFLLIDAFINSPYMYIAKYTTLIGIGSYYILKDNASFNQFTKIFHTTMIHQMGVKVEEIEKEGEEDDIYADMPPLISLKEIAAAAVAAVAAEEAAAAVVAAVAAVAEAAVAENKPDLLPPSPPDSEDDMPPPLEPIPDIALMLPVEETVPEEFVPVYDMKME